MSSVSPSRLARAWPVAVPVLAVALLAATWGRHLGPVLVGVVALVLAGAVLAAVQHAEVIAHRLGEPFGSLVLAVAVTVIEVALIVTLMASGGAKAESLARDTVFAAVMITSNGIVGLSLLVGAARFTVAHFNPEGTGAALATVVVAGDAEPGAADLHLERPGPAVLAGAAGLRGGRVAGALRAVRAQPDRAGTGTSSCRSPRPARWRRPRSTPTRRPPAPRWTSLALLLLALVAVVGLAKVESPSIESGGRGASASRRRSSAW